MRSLNTRRYARPIGMLTLLGLVCLPARTTPAQVRALDQVQWLVGCWELSAGNRRVVERWAAPVAGVMSGSSRTLIGGEPRESEQLRLFVRADTLVYEAIPAGQRLTEFAARTLSARELVFENPAHDFPQRIVYTRVGADSVIARIEGDRAGRRAPVSFPFRKIACTPDTPPPGEIARAELDPFYRNLAAREVESGAGTNAWMAANAAPGFVLLTWTNTSSQPGIASAETLRRAAEAAKVQ